MRQRSRRSGRKTGDRAARYYALAVTLGLTIAAVSGYGTALIWPHRFGPSLCELRD